jgi:glutamine synthetase
MDENVLGQIRRGMQGAGIPVEFSKGEAWYGQHELNMRYADAVTSADRHAIYKNGVKEIAFLNGVSATFMAKPSEKDIGSSCHIHSSLVQADSGDSVFVDGHEETDTFRHYIGGLRARIRELALLIAPSVNSYKRYASESWAPTSISWGRDNRTCGFRVVGHGQSRRAECRIPGADVNPYLGYAALLAAGLDGIENGTDPGPELVGNAYAAGEAEPFPSTLREAVDLWEASTFARAAFGDDVWRHYLNYGRTEQRLFDEVVTDYERRRMFERG